MRVKGNLVFDVVLFLVFGLGLIFTFSFGTWESMLFPMIVSGGCFVLMSIQLCKQLLTKNHVTQEDPNSNIQPTTARPFALWTVVAWLVGFIVGAYFLGFNITTFAFVFLYLKHRKRGLLVSGATAAITIIVLYCIFKFALNVELYHGLILQWLGLG